MQVSLEEGKTIWQVIDLELNILTNNFCNVEFDANFAINLMSSWYAAYIMYHKVAPKPYRKCPHDNGRSKHFEFDANCDN